MHRATILCIIPLWFHFAIVAKILLYERNGFAQRVFSKFLSKLFRRTVLYSLKKRSEFALQKERTREREKSVFALARLLDAPPSISDHNPWKFETILNFILPSAAGRALYIALYRFVSVLRHKFMSDILFCSSRVKSFFRDRWSLFHHLCGVSFHFLLNKIVKIVNF